MSNCIFCKIGSDEIPSEKLFDDDICYVIKDINPKSRVHLLIVPYAHIETIMDITEVDEKMIGHLLFVAGEMGRQMDLEGFKIKIHVGEKGGQEIPHIHIHLLAS